MNIKKLGIDLFVACHPKVVALKKSAKILHKELKSLTLMQCQELVAQKNGFNNWHHFMQLIKKYYQEGLENIPFLVTNSDKEKNHILMGYDINLDHYKWQDRRPALTHHLILGEDIYKTYDLFMAKQLLNQKLVFIHDGSVNNLDSLKRLAMLDRQNFSDFKIFDQKTSNLKIHNSFEGSSGGLTELLIQLLPEYSGHTVSYLSVIFMVLAFRRDKYKETIKLQSILKSLDKIEDDVYPEHIENAIKLYQPIEHELKPIRDLIEHLLESNIFSDSIEDSFKLSSLLDRNNKDIFFIHPGSELLSKLILGSLKLSMATLLGSSLEDSQANSLKTVSQLETIYLFIRNQPILSNLAVIPAQARALGISMTFSYPKIEDRQEFLSIAANCNTKILGPNELTFKEKQNDFLTVENNQFVINPEYQRRYEYIYSYKLKDFVWLIKKDNISQVKF